jgi:uncharacterized protein (TIGR00661 family)
MRILYAIQGTGNGHLARAADIVPALRKYGRVDTLISGTQADILPEFHPQYILKGLSFHFGRNGGIDFAETFARAGLRRLFREVRELPVDKYDLVVNDFEPVSAWACRIREVPCVALGHQASFLSAKCPRPKFRDPFGEWILRKYAPAGRGVGFHFREYDKDIFTPVIRKAVRDKPVADKGHLTVYLPAYSDKKLVRILGKVDGVRWQVFSKKARSPESAGSVRILPVDSRAFVNSLITSHGVLCGAGFETPAEALFLGKRLMVVPMAAQYEQQCNAAALRKMGVPMLRKLRKKKISRLEEWLADDKSVHVTYDDPVGRAIERVWKIYSERK